MPRCKPHSHPCSVCGAKTECSGAWEENYDGEPAVICPEYHLPNVLLRYDFMCEGCLWAEEDKAAGMVN